MKSVKLECREFCFVASLTGNLKLIILTMNHVNIRGRSGKAWWWNFWSTRYSTYSALVCSSKSRRMIHNSQYCFWYDKHSCHVYIASFVNMLLINSFAGLFVREATLTGLLPTFFPLAKLSLERQILKYFKWERLMVTQQYSIFCSFL